MLSSKQILNEYLNFYKNQGHKQIPNMSLVPENDPSLLFVNSGMFPLVPYLFGEDHPLGKRLLNVQRCLRFNEDLDEIGDYNHTIAFHMIGNWSLGEYFKKEQLPWIYEVYIEKLGIDVNKVYATVFVGDEDAPKDETSIELLKQIFKKYGIDAKVGERIFAYGKDENWWKRGDAIGEPGGPDSEMFYYIGKDGNGEGKNPVDNEDEFLEIGNNVFMQYKKSENGWEELSQKNVDFGGGLERLAMVVQGKKDIYETDNFAPIIKKIEELTNKKYNQSPEVTRSMRILADHIRACTFLAMDGVVPSNKEQGYVLRRLLRRMVRAGMKLGVKKDISVNLVKVVGETFEWMYPEILKIHKKIETTFANEETNFRKVLVKGAKETQKFIDSISSSEDSDNTIRDSKENKKTPQKLAEKAFDLYQSNGYPGELFLEDLKDAQINVDEKEFNKIYDDFIEQHQKQSRAGAEQKFKGGLADSSEQTIKYHTATHLLHWALRQVLGETVQQKGSNITSDRLRFDFSHPQKLTEQQITQIEELINQKAGTDLPVNFKMMSKQQAKETGALHFFGEKYGDQVKVYYIGQDLETAFSKEFCGGPHIDNLNVLGKLKIFKQKSIGKGILRVYLKEN